MKIILCNYKVRFVRFYKDSLLQIIVVSEKKSRSQFQSVEFSPFFLSHAFLLFFLPIVLLLLTSCRAATAGVLTALFYSSSPLQSVSLLDSQ